MDNIIIYATAPFQPVVKISGLNCHDLFIGHGATVVIDPGQILTVNGEVTIEGQVSIIASFGGIF